jgi:3-oxoacid CoA-transferase subunit A
VPAAIWLKAPMSQKIPTPAAALEGLLFDGMTIMSGGFGLPAIPKA